MEPRISIVTLGVTDLPRAVRFYRDGLGFPSDAKESDPIAFFVTTGTRLALYPRAQLAADISPGVPPAGGGFGGITLAHNVRERDEVDSVLAQAVAAGGRLEKAGQPTDWGGYSGYFSDPDGYFWEVAWGPMFEFDGDGNLILPGAT